MKLRILEIVQDLDKIDMAVVKEQLKKDRIKDYAYIIHDKDVDKEGNLIRSHVHITLRLKNPYDTKYISEWFGIKEQYIQTIKSWSGMLNYLTHKNKPEKFQYKDENVISNFDWKKEADKNNGQRLKEIQAGIISGEIKEYNYQDYVDYPEWGRYKSVIKNWFELKRDKSKGVDREMEVIFITGDAGTGKTTYAKECATNLNYKIFISSGSNDPFDSYKGEECIILDDLRGSTMHVTDLLKVLDNNTESTIKSRYYNKVMSNCKLVIITTTLDIDTFFSELFKHEKEVPIQLKRRCKTHIRFEKENIYLSRWSNNLNSYTKEFKFPNPIPLKYKDVEITENEALDYFSKMFGISKEFIDDYKKENVDYKQEELKEIKK